MDAHLPTLRSARVKTAQDPISRYDAATQVDASRRLLAILAGAFGAGILGRSLLGANRLSKKSPRVMPGSNVMINLPSHHKEEEDAKLKYAALHKMAADNDWLSQLSKPVIDLLFNRKNFITGNRARNWYTYPLFWPTVGVGGLAALGGGYKLTDKILDARRKAELNAELEEAKRQYQEAVQNRLKTAAHVDETDPVTLLDELAVTGIEKAANDNPITSIGNFLGDTASGIGSLYLAYALMTGLGSGKLMYDYMRRKSPRKITEEALKQRARQRYGLTPPVYISQHEPAAK